MANVSVDRIGILTSGGDCPGLNAAIRAVVKAARTKYGMDVIGFRDGFQGLVANHTIPLSYDDVSNIMTLGGTVLGSGERARTFRFPEELPPDSSRTPPDDALEKALRTFRSQGLTGIVVTGGDGTLRVAHHLHQQGIPIIGIPKTIDNDVPHCDTTIGFDTAVTVATESIDRLHSTAASHHRVIVVEVMGNQAGWIALHAGVAGGGDIILIPEIEFSMNEVCRVVGERTRRGRRFSLVVLAEGAGKGADLARTIAATTEIESRAVVLGYLLRGGTPSPADRILATELGCAAVELAARGEFGKAVCWRSGGIAPVDLRMVATQPRRVTSECTLLNFARAVGTSFGDEPGRSP